MKTARSAARCGKHTLKKDAWLAEPENSEPAHTEEARYAPAPAKVQALVDAANQRGIRGVSHEDFERLPGPKMTLGQYDASLAKAPSGHQGRAPRSAENTRTKGSRRITGSGTTSSGEDDDPHLPPRLCSECGAHVPHRRKTCGDKCRQQRSRRKRKARECRKKGHTVEYGRCDRCGADVRRPRKFWQDKRIRSWGASPDVDPPEWTDGGGGQRLLDHTAGPADVDIYTLKVGSGRPKPATWSSTSFGDSDRVWLDPPEGLLRWRERRGA